MDNNINIELALKYATNVLNNLEKPDIKTHLKKSLKLLQTLTQTDQVTELITLTKKEYNKIKKENIFHLVKTNNIQKVKKLNNINFNEIDKYGNTILHFCIKVGDVEILKELFKLGGNINSVNGNGHTLLEYSCLCKDPNMINYLLLFGADMKKHLFFRKGNDKYYLNKDDIDMAILLKLLIFRNKLEETNINNFSFLNNHFNFNELIGIEKFTLKDIVGGLEILFHTKQCTNTYINIITEELLYYEKCVSNKIETCYKSKIDILLVNLLPFINYPFNLASEFYLKKELSFIIDNLKDKKDYKNLIVNTIFKKYIENTLFKEDYIGIIIYKLLKNIKI